MENQKRITLANQVLAVTAVYGYMVNDEMVLSMPYEELCKYRSGWAFRLGLTDEEFDTMKC